MYVQNLATDVTQAAQEASGGGKKPAKSQPKMIEKVGAIIGIRDMAERDFRYPFKVSSVKQVRLLCHALFSACQSDQA